MVFNKNYSRKKNKIMQHLKLLSATIFSACLLFACSSNNSTSAGKDSTSNATLDNSGSSASNGDGSFSYTIDGNKVDVKSLYINKVKNLDGGLLKIEITNSPTGELFKFTIANTGTTTILHYHPSFSAQSKEADYLAPGDRDHYYGDSVIVNITDINATHVAGTFSGKYLSDDKPPVALEITDGSFDLPFTKDTKN